MRLGFLVVALALCAAAAIGANALAAGAEEPASATAIAVIVKVPGQDDVSAGYASSPPDATGGADAYTFGETVRIASATTKAQTAAEGAPQASASAELLGVSLLGGAITADRLVAESSATATGTPSGDFGGSLVEGLVVLGAPVTAAANTRIDLGDLGYAIALEQAVQREDAEGPGFRGFVSVLHVYLAKDHMGLPAGSELVVGYAEAAAHAETPASTASAGEGATQQGAGSDAGAEGGSEPAQAPPGAHGGPPPIVRNPPADVRPNITGLGFVFPVYGSASFSDDFAAPRADTIWHHGNDIFAPLGVPALAVTDGTLFLVGWNRLGGHRLWLRDDAGNEYYYAHLSAYSPLAVDGARVQAGAVLGFVGASGAAGGATHLHFEIHPQGLLGLGYDGVIDPYAYLLSWRGQEDRTFRVAAPVASAAQPGAVLLEAHDISSVSGLDGDAIERLLAGSPFVPGVEDAGLLEPSAPGLVGAPAGFPAS